MIKLTKTGKVKVRDYIAGLEAQREAILDAGKDSVFETTLPDINDILSDIESGVGVDSDGDYFNCWGVTDNYSSDCPLGLKENVDFVCIK